MALNSRAPSVTKRSCKPNKNKKRLKSFILKLFFSSIYESVATQIDVNNSRMNLGRGKNQLTGNFTCFSKQSFNFTESRVGWDSLIQIFCRLRHERSTYKGGGLKCKQLADVIKRLFFFQNTAGIFVIIWR